MFLFYVIVACSVTIRNTFATSQKLSTIQLCTSHRHLHNQHSSPQPALISTTSTQTPGTQKITLLPQVHPCFFSLSLRRFSRYKRHLISSHLISHCHCCFPSLPFPSLPFPRQPASTGYIQHRHRQITLAQQTPSSTYLLLPSRDGRTTRGNHYPLPITHHPFSSHSIPFPADSTPRNRLRNNKRSAGL